MTTSKAPAPGQIGNPAACRALAQFESQDVENAVPSLLKLANDANGMFRMDAMAALGNLKTGAAVPDLIKALDDPHVTVRWEAVQALAKFGPAAKDAAPMLRHCLSDPEPSVQMAAEAALKKIVKEPIPK